MTTTSDKPKAKRPVDLVIDKVKTAVKKGKGVNLTQIHRDSGYAEASATSHKARHSKKWKKEMNTLLEKMKERREDAIDAIDEKELSDERLRDLVNMVDKLTDNIRLIEGRSTENKEYRIVEGEVIDDKDNEKVQDAEYEELEQLGDSKDQ